MSATHVELFGTTRVDFNKIAAWWESPEVPVI